MEPKTLQIKDINRISSRQNQNKRVSTLEEH